MTDLQNDFAERFPILHEMVFLNHAGVAPISGPAADAIRQYARQAESIAYVDAGWYRRANQVKRAAAKLIHADSHREIAFIPNTSSGLSLVANGLDFSPGDNVVITNVEYPANRYPWENLKRLGVEVIEVKQGADGRINVRDVCDAITNHTRVVSISHVQYASGHRIDLKPISEMVHMAGGYLCVDAIQSVGVLPVDVQDMGIDFLSADGHKWLLGPEGAGIFYCREELCPLLRPSVVGWMNMVDADNYGDYRFEFQPDARRFEPGSWNLPGIHGLGASIDLLLEIGIENVWRRVDALTSRFCDGATKKGYEIFSPRDDPDERSGIVIFSAPQRLGGPDSHRRIVHDLGKGKIVIALREGRLRISPHFYNTAEQIDRLIDALP
jgi:selenocysteine lyase/cysteine desulfurase